MTIPAFLFGSLVAIFLGTLFHLWKGGGPFYILLYIFVSLLGFWAGNYASQYLQIAFWNIGPVRYGPALVSALFFLVITSWLFKRNPAEK